MPTTDPSASRDPVAAPFRRDLQTNAATSSAPVQRYDITHQTTFSYSAPVGLDQLVVRLQPRTGVNQRLVSFAIELDPTPARQTTALDLHGNIRHWFWFEDSHAELKLVTRSTVDCFCANPFDFIIVDPNVEQVPAIYEEPVRSATDHYRLRSHAEPEVDDLMRELISETGGNTTAFLQALAARIARDVKQVVRVYGDPYSPAETLNKGEAACRDTAVLFMEVARAAGLAARFVSGYAYDALDPDRRELHAWAEVYLPGAGWRGFDPSVGLAVSNRHVAVAASPTPNYAAPTSGTFTAPPVDSKLTYRVDMDQTEYSSPEIPEGTVYLWT